MHIQKQTIPFGFIDETGLGYPDNQQPFLGIGLFKIYNTHQITSSLLKEYYAHYTQSRRIRSNLVSRVVKRPKNLTFEEIQKLLSINPNFEYKFENINQRSLGNYCRLLDALFEYNWSFSCVLIDKTDTSFNPEIYKDYWNAYLIYTKLLVKNATKKDTGISLIADFLDQPKSIQRSFETEMLRVPAVVNAMQADSRALMHLQIVDLLLGAVSFHAKRQKGTLADSKRTKAKEDFVDYLASKLKLTRNDTNPYPLAYSLTVSKPCHFNVWKVKFD